MSLKCNQKVVNIQKCEKNHNKKHYYYYYYYLMELQMDFYRVVVVLQ
jgi:hypothetical protein